MVTAVDTKLRGQPLNRETVLKRRFARFEE